MREPKGSITNIIGKGTSINGKVKVLGSIHIDGVVDGNMEVSESLIIGKSGKIRGDIHSKDCLVGGKVEGNLFSDEKVEFQSGASLKGDIKCKRLVIEEGVVFDGNCIMSEKTIERKSTNSANLDLSSPSRSRNEAKQLGISASSNEVRTKF